MERLDLPNILVGAAPEGERGDGLKRGVGDTSEEESVFSDYSYNRVSLIGHVEIWKEVSANIFLDYQPEDHKREGDDATATLFSGSLSYRF